MAKRYRVPILILAASLVFSAASLAVPARAEEAPAGSAPAAGDMELWTYRNIPYTAQFLASGGTELTCALDGAPKKGEVTIRGTDFTYTPRENAVGTDRFTYTVTDGAGNTSTPAEVTVRIEKPRSGVAYSDMDGSPAAAAAQLLAEEGIFTGKQMGERYYFEPEAQVTRGEFLAMALETAGREVSAVTMTGFADDGAIPAWAKGYAAAGVADGLLLGVSTAEGAAFRGGDPITLGEAATVLDRMLDVGDVELAVWFADREAAPSWAAQAVGNMESVHVLAAGSFGGADTSAPVTRAEAAQMLAAAHTLLAGERRPGLWDLLG